MQFFADFTKQDYLNIGVAFSSFIVGVAALIIAILTFKDRKAINELQGIAKEQNTTNKNLHEQLTILQKTFNGNEKRAYNEAHRIRLKLSSFYGEGQKIKTSARELQLSYVKKTLPVIQAAINNTVIQGFEKFDSTLAAIEVNAENMITFYETEKPLFADLIQKYPDDVYSVSNGIKDEMVKYGKILFPNYHAK